VKILIIDFFEAEFIDGLAHLPLTAFDYVPKADRAEVLRRLPGHHAVVMKSKTNVDADFLAHAPDLKLIVRAGVGVEHIDEALCAARGIAVHSTPGGNADAVAEHALGMLLALMNNLRRADATVRRFEWEREPNRGHEVRGKTVGVIGYGHTGSAFAQKISGFGANVLAYDKYKTGFGGWRAQEVPMEAIFAQAQILTLHVPLTPETHHLVNDSYLARFKHPIWLLNLSRGPVVDTAALLRALQSGKVLGAGIDVFENENFATLTPAERELYGQLFATTNTIFSPHIGGWSYESAQRINQMCLDILRAYLTQ
jgi:D-3-phosphoglycerate dehydrogenase